MLKNTWRKGRIAFFSMMKFDRSAPLIYQSGINELNFGNSIQLFGSLSITIRMNIEIMDDEVKFV